MLKCILAHEQKSSLLLLELNLFYLEKLHHSILRIRFIHSFIHAQTIRLHVELTEELMEKGFRSETKDFKTPHFTKEHVNKIELEHFS